MILFYCYKNEIYFIIQNIRIEEKWLDSCRPCDISSTVFAEIMTDNSYVSAQKFG